MTPDEDDDGSPRRDRDGGETTGRPWDIEDGCGCVEVWERLSERRASD